MKFKLASDFYKALALFSQAGCPLTQAGSSASQTHIARPLTALSAVAHPNNACQSTESLKSAPSTADSDQRTLVPSCHTSMQTSSRPSTSSGSPWKSRSEAFSYSIPAYDLGRTLACSEKPQLSPFFSEAKRPPVIMDTNFRQHEKRSAAHEEARTDCFLPSASDPTAASTSQAVGSEHRTLRSYPDPTAPRPSTAPTFHSERLSQMLPPKRELPFKVSRITSVSSREDPKSGQAPSTVKAGNSDTSAMNGLGSIVQVKHLKNHVPSEALKAPRARRATKAARGTRDTAVASRSCRKSAVSKESTPVPTVEELLRRSERLSEKQAVVNLAENDASKVSVPISSSAVTKLGHDLHNEAPMEASAMTEGRAKQLEDRLTAYKCRNLDTQTLLARADEHQRRQNFKRKSVEEADERSSPLPPSKRIASDAQLNPAALPPPGDGVQEATEEAATAYGRVGHSRSGDMRFLPKATSVNASHGYDSQENDGVRPSAQKSMKELSADLVDVGNTKHSERPSLAEISNAAHPGPPHPLVSNSTMSLMSEPDFAQPPETAEWANLPPEERDAALEAWMCQQLESESFVTLMKTLDGMWQRIFFGG